MIEVKIINKEKQIQTHGGFFKTNAEAQNWINAVSAKLPCPWGSVGSFDVQIIDNTAAFEAERLAKESLKLSVENLKLKIKSKTKLTDEELSLVLEYILSKI